MVVGGFVCRGSDKPHRSALQGVTRLPRCASDGQPGQPARLRIRAWGDEDEALDGRRGIRACRIDWRGEPPPSGGRVSRPPPPNTPPPVRPPPLLGPPPPR